MAGWAGFSDEDLKRLKHCAADNSGNSTQINKKTQQKRQRTTNRHNANRKPENISGNNPQVLNQAERLSVADNENRLLNGTEAKLTGEQNHGLITSDKAVGPAQPKTDATSNIRTNKGDKSDDKATARELDDDEAISVELENVVRFQKQQKAIEEANREKKQFLAKAINERKKKAKAESAKLTKIQVELNHLDTLLNVDVGVIRDKIEAASIEYVEAQRRYNKAEQEFINSKMCLFDKGEMKERLTEHLYTIIHQNELRKATKLGELMKQLEMEVEQDIDLTFTTIPLLTNFNSVTTLHNPAHHQSLASSPEVGKVVQLVAQSQGGDEKCIPEIDMGKEVENSDVSKGSDLVDSVCDKVQNMDISDLSTVPVCMKNEGDRSLKTEENCIKNDNIKNDDSKVLSKEEL